MCLTYFNDPFPGEDHQLHSMADEELDMSAASQAKARAWNIDTLNLHISWENPWLIQLKIHDRLVYPMFEKGTTDRLRFPLQPIHLKQTLKRRLEEMMIFGDGAGFEYLLC